MLWSLLFCSITGCLASIQHLPVVEFTENSTELLEKWRTFESRIDGLSTGIVKLLLSSMSQSGFELEPDCELALTELVFAIKSNKLWAYRLLDSLGKPRAGILEGSVTSLGNYDECLGVDGGSPGLRGQYCVLDLRLPLPPKSRFYRFDEEVPALKNFTTRSELVALLKSDAINFYFVAFRFGLCTPSACSIHDVNKIAKSALSGFGLNGEVISCQIETGLQLEKDQLIIMIVLSSFVCLVIFTTLVHGCLANKKRFDTNGVTWQLLQGFSINRTLKSTLSARSSESDEQLGFLHGLKYISMTWVMLGHTYLFLNWQLFDNLRNAKRFSQDFLFQAVINASVSVDTFFFVTAVLVAVLTLGSVERYGSGAFKPWLLFIHRYWRTVPTTMVAVGLMILLPLIGSGPLWHETLDVFVQNCRKNWWPILLGGNNFVHPRDTCLQHTWYVSCDLQFFVFALLYFWLHFKNEWYSRILAGAFLLCGVIATGVTTFILEFPPTMLLPNIDPEGRWEIWRYHYFLPSAHTGPYALGLLVGTFITKKRKLPLNRMSELLGWVLAFAVNVSVLFSTYLWSVPRRASPAEAVAYSALHRLGWALGLTWLTLVCSQGHGGPVRSLLSWNAWKPLGRLSFSVYLLHFMVLWAYVAPTRTPVDARHNTAIWTWLGHVVICTALALLFRILFESPLLTLERVALGRLVRKKVREIELKDKIDPSFSC